MAKREKELEVNKKDLALQSDDSQEWIHKYNDQKYSLKYTKANPEFAIQQSWKAMNGGK